MTHIGLWLVLLAGMQGQYLQFTQVSDGLLVWCRHSDGHCFLNLKAETVPSPITWEVAGMQGQGQTPTMTVHPWVQSFPACGYAPTPDEPCVNYGSAKPEPMVQPAQRHKIRRNQIPNINPPDIMSGARCQQAPTKEGFPPEGIFGKIHSVALVKTMEMPNQPSVWVIKVADEHGCVLSFWTTSGEVGAFIEVKDISSY